MKITGYTVLYSILIISLIIGIYHLEIYLYDRWITNKINGHDDFIAINTVLGIVIFAILGFTGAFNKLDKLLKKRIL